MIFIAIVNYMGDIIRTWITNFQGVPVVKELQ